jgi:mannosyl-oligosaccharide alpha-1,2-mannosidase
MPFKSVCAVAVLLVSHALASPANTPLRRANPQPDVFRASQVQDAFRTAWKGYYEHAFPHDTLLPLHGGGSADDR